MELNTATLMQVIENTHPSMATGTLTQLKKVIDFKQ
jgi:hypothetical protein